MSVEPEKKRTAKTFRCYQCRGMLGVSKAKSGATVRCPKCGADLIVPDFSEAPAVDLDEVAALKRLGSLIGVDERVAPAIPGGVSVGARPPEFAPDISFDNVAAFTGDASAPRSSTKITPASVGIETPDAFADEEAASIEVETPKAILAGHARGRSRDVSVPRNFLTAWSFLAILATAFAFTAGLLIGHYVWKSR